ncbi:MAG TPA: EAL domain-containing protein [Thermoanaerobaculia bacterium]|jgi:EAL domain-containing protein (putative c-di-GMP-specific phosphodiesterase class I)
MTKEINGPDESVVLILDRVRERATVSASAFASDNHLVLTGGDAVVGLLVGRRMALSSMVTEAQIAGRFSFDGLDAVADVRRTTPSCRIVVTGEDLPESVAEEAMRRGASDVVRRPFQGAEFREQLGLGDPNGEGMILHIPTIDEFTSSESLSPAFQPIVDLANPERGVGYESLARFREKTLPFCDPSFMFEYARLCDRTAELDLACLRRTLRAARELPEQGKIFINIHPRVLADGDVFLHTLVSEAGRNQIALSRLVLEITEQEKLTPTESTLPAVDVLRTAGVQFALDDVGASYAHLDLISRIRPSYLKIGHEFGTDFEKDPSRKKIIRNIQSLARDFECEVILEGVETAETSRAAADIGARYAQGFFYARPAEASALVQYANA